MRVRPGAAGRIAVAVRGGRSTPPWGQVHHCQQTGPEQARAYTCFMAAVAEADYRIGQRVDAGQAENGAAKGFDQLAPDARNRIEAWALLAPSVAVLTALPASAPHPPGCRCCQTGSPASARACRQRSRSQRPVRSLRWTVARRVVPGGCWSFGWSQARW